MDIPFKKMHGTGNDFVLIKASDLSDNSLYSKLALNCCHRRFGIGADGLIAVESSVQADTRMLYFNSDGSQAEMCGNGIRCFAKFVFDEGIVRKKQFTVETLSGIKTVEVTEKNGKTESVKVNMGKMVLNVSAIPVLWDRGTEFINQEIEIEGVRFFCSTVLMGVPHTVIFTSDMSSETVKKYGPLIEKHPMFPSRTNVNFAGIVSRNHIRVSTWERGAGYTLSCGTGVTSVCGVGNYMGLTDEKVTVDVDGGRLNITIAGDGHIYMEGPAADICRGTYFAEFK